jgi:uncharacterized membrane protein YhhN
VAGLLALRTGDLAFKLAVPVACGLALIAGFPESRAARGRWAPIVVAFIFSALGDFLLSTRAGRASFFLGGIAAFFVAHLGYLTFALSHGRMHRLTLAVLVAGFLTYYGLSLFPRVQDWPTRLAVLAYLLVSCVSMAAALGLQLPRAAKAFFVVGIGLIVLSDTLISLTEFVGYRWFDGLILPTYYAALLSVCLAGLTQSGGCLSPRLPSSTI